MTQRSRTWASLVVGTAMLASTLTATAGAVIGNEPSAPRAAAVRDAAVHAFGLRDARLVRLDVPAAPGAPILAAIDLDEGPDLILLQPFSVRATGYQVLVEQRNGTLATAPPSAQRTMRGRLLGRPGARVTASLLADGLHARIQLPTGEVRWVEPLADRVDGAVEGDYLVYRKQDIIETPHSCGAHEGLRLDAQLMEASLDDGGTAGATEGTAVAVAELACDADFEFYQDYGSVAAVETRINAIVNTVNAQYESAVGISHAISTIIVRTSSSQPYTSTDPSTLLSEFRNHWNANHGAIQRDVAHLFTGKNLDGSVIGIAYVGAICGSAAYGVSQLDFTTNDSCSTDLVAHELGHNWNASHCSCSGYTMNPSITCANQFHPTSTIPTIVSFRDSRSCLDTTPGEPTGGCCVGSACSIETEVNCTALGGSWLGAGSDCAGSPCGCAADEIEDCNGNCAPAVWVGDGVCDDGSRLYNGLPIVLNCAEFGDDGGDCIPVGGCCVASACTIETEVDCGALGGTWLGDGSGCEAVECIPGGDVLNLAVADHATGDGTVAGSFLDTHAQDDAHQALTEEESNGNPARRRSMLSHTWRFDVAPGAGYAFAVEAFRSPNAEGDDFLISYSLDDDAYIPMVTIASSVDDGHEQSYVFTEDIAGTVYVRVEDTDRTRGNRGLDTLWVDSLYILSNNSGDDVFPPAPPAGLVAIAADQAVDLDWDDGSEPDLVGWNLYRSTSSAGPYASLSPMPLVVSQFTDAGLVNGTTYYYVVTAVDLAGNESGDSAVSSATPGAGPALMHVAHIDVMVENIGGGQKRGRADVIVRDDLGNPIAGATVTGSFTGAYAETVSATTDVSGLAVLRTTQTQRGSISFTMCVNDVIHASAAYDAAGNTVTCASR